MSAPQQTDNVLTTGMSAPGMCAYPLQAQEFQAGLEPGLRVGTKAGVVGLLSSSFAGTAGKHCVANLGNQAGGVLAEFYCLVPCPRRLAYQPSLLA